MALEFHGGFKSVCDSFSLNLTQFEQVFSSNESTFRIFDTDHNGLIDCFELFAGLVLFSDSGSEDKIRFLFDLFDFNNSLKISLRDLEFMIECCITSTAKMYN